MSFNLNSFPSLCRLPLGMITNLSGKSQANLYAEITGISASRLRPDSKQNMPNPTLEKVRASECLDQLALKAFKEIGNG
ncbi:MAG: hypothetical protein H7240_06920 [Glaciimonas sp.]|nr:hypothetical protein [Glaciimonas sp.]